MYSKKFEDIFSKDTLLDALSNYQKAQDYDEVLEQIKSGKFENDIQKGFIPKPVRAFSIEKDKSQKRELALSSTASKVIQKILATQLQDVVKFSNRSYAYRKNKGTLKAIRRTIDIFSTHYWVAKADIDNFFDTIDQDILIQKLEKHIVDKRIIKLISVFLSNGMLRGKKWIDKKSGIYQGDNLSPLLSNIYLAEFDEFLENKHIEFVRFADDMVFFAKHKRDAAKILDIAEGYLNSLKLSFGKDKSYIANKKEGFEYLGLRFVNDKVTIDNKKLMKKVSKLSKKTKNKNLSKSIDIINEHVDGIKRYYAKILKDTSQLDLLQEHIDRILISKIKTEKQNKTINKKSLFKKMLYELKSYHPMSKNEKKEYDELLISKAYELIALDDPLKSAKKDIAKHKTEFLKSQIKSSELILSKYGLYASISKGKIIVKEYGKVIKKMPLNYATRIIIINRGVTISVALIHECAKRKIDIDFIDRNTPYAVITYHKNINNEAHLKQLDIKNAPKGLKIAKQIISAKAKNQINLIKYYARYREDSDKDEFEKLTQKLKQMQSIFVRIKTAQTRETLMGYEGSISTLYWNCFGIIIDKEEFTRETYNAPDSINQAINYGYAFIYNRVQAALVKNGLNLYHSFLHVEQANKPTLVYDMVEEFRQPVVDREILSILAKGTKLTSSKGKLTNKSIKLISQNIQERLISPTKWRKGKYKITSIIDEQAQLLSQVIKTDGKKYKGFVVRY
jgi:group II intron reverse transcriptase/maturase/CRISPR-associated endonuclease Cas1